MVLRGQQYPISEYARLFPDMDAGDYGGLVASIRELGLLEPIAVWRGQVIDGRHRCQACLEAGVEPSFVHLDDDSDPLAFILAKNRARRHLDPSQRALIAYGLCRDSRPGGDRRSDDYQRSTDHSAFLPNGLTQKQAAELLQVSLRLVRDTARVMSPDSQAAPALRTALREGRIKVSDAKKALDQPAEVQEAALALVESGAARNLRGALTQVKSERDEAAEAAAAVAIGAGPLDENVTLHQAALPDLPGLVPPASVDIIFCHPPHGPDSLPRLTELAAFAAHALKPTGALLVISGMERLPQTLEALKNRDLRWVAEFDYRDNSMTSRSGPPHRIQLRRKPLLVYGKPAFRLPPGDDVIELPPPEEGSGAVRQWQLHNAGVDLIVQRFARPGQLICDPMMLGRASALLAARKLGCPFIGADRENSLLAKIRRYLAEAEG